MLSIESGPVLRLTVNPSTLLLVAVSLVHLVALCSIGLIDVSLLVQFALVMLIWGSGVHYWYRHWNRPRIRQIDWHDSSRIVVTGDHQAISGELHKVYCLNPWLISFSVRNTRGTKQQCLLLKDQVDPDRFRRLSVQLRFANPAVADIA